MVYFIEAGQVKLLIPSHEGKECLLAVRTAGDIIGELSLSGQTTRIETAVAMKEVVLKQIPKRCFLTYIKNASLFEGLIQYLVELISEQQEVIASMSTVNSEQRLARTLLNLGQRIGRGENGRVRLEQRLSQEELSEMVGTTRTRVGVFLKKFRTLRLIRFDEARHIIIEEKKLQDFLYGNTFAANTQTGIHREETDLHHACSLKPCGQRPVGVTPRNALLRASAGDI